MLKTAAMREVMNSSPYPLGIRQEVMGLNCSSGGFGLDRRKTFLRGWKKHHRDRLPGFGASASVSL